MNGSSASTRCPVINPTFWYLLVLLSVTWLAFSLVTGDRPVPAGVPLCGAASSHLYLHPPVHLQAPHPRGPPPAHRLLLRQPEPVPPSQKVRVQQFTLAFVFTSYVFDVLMLILLAGYDGFVKELGKRCLRNSVDRYFSL